MLAQNVPSHELERDWSNPLPSVQRGNKFFNRLGYSQNVQGKCQPCALWNGLSKYLVLTHTGISWLKVTSLLHCSSTRDHVQLEVLRRGLIQQKTLVTQQIQCFTGTPEFKFPFLYTVVDLNLLEWNCFISVYFLLMGLACFFKWSLFKKRKLWLLN